MIQAYTQSVARPMKKESEKMVWQVTFKASKTETPWFYVVGTRVAALAIAEQLDADGYTRMPPDHNRKYTLDPMQYTITKETEVYHGA